MPAARGGGEFPRRDGGAAGSGIGGCPAGADHVDLRHRGARDLPAARPGRAGGGDRERGSRGRPRAGGTGGGFGSDGDAGDAGDLAPAAGVRLGGSAGAQGAMRRRGAATGAGLGAARAWRRAVEPVRPDRDDRVVGGWVGGLRRGRLGARPADRQTPAPRRRSRGGAGAGRGGRRAADRRRGGGARLLGAAGADGGTLRARPLEPGRRGAALPDGRPGPASAESSRRRAGVPGPHRPSDQAAGVPHRARRGRGGAGEPSGGARGGGAAARRPGRRRWPGGLRRVGRRETCSRCAAGSRSACPAT